MPLVAARLADHDVVAAAAVVSTALACVDVATEALVASDGR